MADGSIVYEVRVDSGNINSDLSRVGALFEKGTQEINRLAANTAQSFGKMLGDIFGTSVTQAESAVTRLGASFNNLKNLAAPLLNALLPVSKELEKIGKLSLDEVGAVTGKTSSADLKNTKESNAGKMGSTSLPSFSVGTSYIPYDDFPALLHKGEAVLTASENVALKAAGGIGGVREASPVIMQNNADISSDIGIRPVEVTLKIGDYEFTQIIADTMNNLYRQWGKNPLK